MINIYDESQKNVDVFAEGWQSRSNNPSRAVADVVMPANAAQTASDVPPTPAPKGQAGSGSRGSAGESFQLNAER